MIVNNRVHARVVLAQIESEDIEIVVSALDTKENDSEFAYSDSCALLKVTLAQLNSRSVAEYWLEPDLFASYFGYSGHEWSEDDVDPVADLLTTVGFINVDVQLLGYSDTVRIK